LLITSEEAAEEHGWDPMARIVQTEVVGVDPVTMLKGPIPATENVLEQAAEMTVGDIDLFEVNEAFASVVGAWLEETGASWEDVNVNAGAIAHGHPLGATGAMFADETPTNSSERGKIPRCRRCVSASGRASRRS